MKPGALVGVALLTLLSVTRTPAQVCVGDCDGSGDVTVNELIIMVNIALGNAQPSACPNGLPTGADFVDIALIIQAVNNALSGCLTATGTPTSTQTQAPTPTETPTHAPGTKFQGALTATSGRFNYNMTLGIPGSDAACSSNFAGSHTCTYAELQTADAANELVGAVDTSSNPVTSFWAIDSVQPFNRQCNTNIPWDYQTAHTGRFGNEVPLAGGHLGALQPSQICAGSS